MSSEIVRLGVDFRSASLQVREQLSFTPAEAAGFLELCSPPGFEELAMLSTCNRTEFYAVCPTQTDATAALLAKLRQWRPDTQPVYRDCARFQQTGEQAVRGLFRVACGLESQILGDTHIQTQLRQAIEIARKSGRIGPVLGAAADCALRAAKRVRRQTAISAGSASVGAAVLRSIRKWSSSRRPLSVLVVGAGQAARDIAAHLAKSRSFSLAFTARRREAAEDIAATYGGDVCAWQSLEARLAAADVVVSAVSARVPVFSPVSMTELAAGRRWPLLVVDTGVPRNADPLIAGIAGITLLDIDCLEREQSAARAQRESQIPAAEAILDEEIERWRRLAAWRQIEPAVKQLYLAAEQLRLRVVEQAHPKTDIHRVTGKLVKTLLAGPVQNLRQAVFCATGAQGGQAIETFRQLAPLLSERR